MGKIRWEGKEKRRGKGREQRGRPHTQIPGSAPGSYMPDRTGGKSASWSKGLDPLGIGEEKGKEGERQLRQGGRGTEGREVGTGPPIGKGRHCRPEESQHRVDLMSCFTTL